MIPRTEWTEHAACRGMDPDIFFPTEGDTYARAREVCRRCEVIGECLDDALAIPVSQDIAGMQGGLTPKERAQTRRDRPVVINKCGTTAGYHAHIGRGERPCGRCVEAWRARNRAKSAASRRRRMEAS